MTDQTNGLGIPRGLDFAGTPILWEDMPAQPVMTLSQLAGNGALVTNSIVETDLISFTVPANTINPDGVLKTVIGLHLGDPGGGFNSTVRLYFGGTKMFTGVWTCPALSTYELMLNWFIRNVGPNHAQYQHLNCFSSPNGLQSPPVNLVTGMIECAALLSSIDPSIDNILRVTAQNSSTGLLRSTRVDFYSISLGV